MLSRHAFILYFGCMKFLVTFHFRLPFVSSRRSNGTLKKSKMAVAANVNFARMVVRPYGKRDPYPGGRPPFSKHDDMT